MEGEATVSKNFIEQEIDKDLAEGRYTESLLQGRCKANRNPCQ